MNSSVFFFPLPAIIHRAPRARQTLVASLYSECICGSDTESHEASVRNIVTQDARKSVDILHNDAAPLEAACVISLLCRGSRRPFAYRQSTD